MAYHDPKQITMHKQVPIIMLNWLAFNFKEHVMTGKTTTKHTSATQKHLTQEGLLQHWRFMYKFKMGNATVINCILWKPSQGSLLCWLPRLDPFRYLWHRMARGHQPNTNDKWRKTTISMGEYSRLRHLRSPKRRETCPWKCNVCDHNNLMNSEANRIVLSRKHPI